MARPIAVITGGAHNIGLAISLRLTADGYRVIVLDIDVPEDESLKSDARCVDLADLDAARSTFEEISAAFDISVLVCNVGIVAPALLDDINLHDFDRLMHINVRSALLAAKILVPSMRRKGQGRIVLTTSRVVLGKVARSIYSATKGAMQAMANTWALELGKDGITVNCVAPGPIATSAFFKNNPPASEATTSLLTTIPVGRIGTSDDVAHAVSFFCEPRSGFITGQTLFVCGGVTVG